MQSRKVTINDEVNNENERNRTFEKRKFYQQMESMQTGFEKKLFRIFFLIFKDFFFFFFIVAYAYFIK